MDVGESACISQRLRVQMKSIDMESAATLELLLLEAAGQDREVRSAPSRVLTLMASAFLCGQAEERAGNKE